MALLNVLWMVIQIRTCYNWCYNSNSLAKKQLSLKHNFSRRADHSELAQKSFEQMIKFSQNRMQIFLRFIMDILTKRYQTLSWTSSRKDIKLYRRHSQEKISNFIVDILTKRYQTLSWTSSLKDIKLYREHTHEKISNFKKQILRLSEGYRGPRTLSLRNLKRENLINQDPQ